MYPFTALVALALDAAWGYPQRLYARIDEALRPGVERASLCIPHGDGPAVALCYERGRVLSRSDEADGIHLEVELPRRLLSPLAAYRQ